MWIYTQNGFYSIVEDRTNPDLLVVRARVKGDIERLWPKAKVDYTTGTDYAYRTRLSRATVAKHLTQEIKTLDYDNFKDRIGLIDRERAHWYGRVWTIMCCLQAALRGEKPWVF